MAWGASGIKKHRARQHWKILLAEDQDDYALLIETALERASPIPVELRRAVDGDEALIMVEEFLPDFILLDLKMPGLSGHEVLEAIKGNDEFRRIPVAVLSSSDRDEDVARSYGLGSNHFIRKPDDPNELEQQLRTLMKYMDGLSGRGGGGHHLRTGVSAHDAGSLALRKALIVVAVVSTIVLLLVYAYIMGLF